jgi:hypothetical protein
MVKEGYEILGANPSPAVTPQIVARKNGKLCFVVVRTDVYPNKGRLADDREFFYNLEHAERNNAVCYFAGIGICNAAATDAGDEAAMGVPVRDDGFYVDFDGLKVMTTLDRAGAANGADSRDRVQGPATGYREEKKAKNSLLRLSCVHCRCP